MLVPRLPGRARGIDSMRRLDGPMPAFAALLALFLAGVAHAVEAGPLQATNVWARASLPGNANGAVYFTLSNPGSIPRILVAAETPRAARAMFHRTRETDAGKTMEHMPRVTVPANGSVTFSPGTRHVMLMGISAPLTAGEAFPLTLHFADDTPPQTVTVDVKPIGFVPD